MEHINIDIDIAFMQMDELSEEDRELIGLAIKATQNAYARYSHFQVGAAVRLSNGATIIGANQENAAFPSGLCAERTAVFAAQVQYPNESITTLAIAARNGNGLLTEPVTPCGACRQVILEVEDRYKCPVHILLYGTNGVYSVKSVKDLLPFSFTDANMHS